MKVLIAILMLFTISLGAQICCISADQVQDDGYHLEGRIVAVLEDDEPLSKSMQKFDVYQRPGPASDYMGWDNENDKPKYEFITDIP